MTEPSMKHKPINEHSLKARLSLSQIKIQQSFKQPIKLLSSLLTAFVYIQCLKYPIDNYFVYWFGDSDRNKQFIGYIDLSGYMAMIPTYVCSSIGLAYFVFSVGLILFEKIITKPAIFAIAKLLQMSFGSVLFMWIIGNNCTSIRNSFLLSAGSPLLEPILAILCLILFTLTLSVQTYTRFDFISTASISGTIRTSNWSSVTLLLYIIINELSSKLSQPQTSIHLIMMSIGLGLHIFVFFLKSEYQEDLPFRIELTGMAVNCIAILLLVSMMVLKVKLDIGLLVGVGLVIGVSIAKLHIFNINFQLENVNKWSNSQIMITYAAKLRKVLLRVKDYYYYTLFLGYIQIHQQKCDNETCPLRNVGIDDNNRKSKFEQIIRKIYGDGCKLSPINPELLLQFAIFHYETNSKQKSMKTLLQIKENDLPLDKYYKFFRLKSLIHRQICQLPHQQFLDLLSQIKVKDLQQKITKKFQQSALISLQFWSILNEDHPDFRKLHEVGKVRVLVSQQVHKLYNQITEIAHSEKVTSLYIHYLNQIQNEEKLYSQMESDIKNGEGFQSKIVIQDWANNSTSILIVSIQQQNFGTIIDLNTTCATLLGYERFDLLGREVKIIFPGILECQVEDFINAGKGSNKNNDQTFYIGYSNGYALKIGRKIQAYNSLQTGLSLIITIQQKFISNVCFMIFNEQAKLLTMSSSCLQLLNLQQTILQSEANFQQLFLVPLSAINDEKTIIKLCNLLKTDKANRFQSDIEPENKQFERIFNVFKKMGQNFFIINFSLIKANKYFGKSDEYSRIQWQSRQQSNFNDSFKFHIAIQNNQFTFIGTSQKESRSPTTIQLEKSQYIERIGKQTIQKDKNYAANITTLRLHQNYIKVIQDSESDGDEGQNKSQASTNNELMVRATKLSKGDEQKIFQSRETYCEFIDKHIKKIYLRTGILVSLLVSLAIYVSLFFLTRHNYNLMLESQNRLILQNRLIGEISQANRILLQTKYRGLSNFSTVDYLLIEGFNKRLSNLQQLIGQYTNPYMLDIWVTPDSVQTFRSDQFILAYISQFSKLNITIAGSQVTPQNSTFPILGPFVLNSNSSWYIEMNGNDTKNKMYKFADQFKAKAHQVSANSLNFIIYFNLGGLIISIIMTIFLFVAMKRINQYKIQILSVFLQTTQKDIQTFSQKTQNFLITLHVDESNQSNQIPQQMMDGKKNSSAMFTKKKRFKTTQFSKASYIVLASFFLFSSAFYIHCFAFSLQKDIFLVDAIQYLNVASKSTDVFSTEQAKIDKKLYLNYGAQNAVLDSKLAGQINSNILAYQRQYFTWHYKTYGSFDEYHQKFSTVFMRDICNGQIQIPHACQSGIMSSNGTLLMLTDITVQNQQIDFSKQLQPQYYLTMETIRLAHQYLLKEIILIGQEFFKLIASSILDILIIWGIVLVTTSIFIGLYMHRVIFRDMIIIKSMLKFLPVSWARGSEGIAAFVATIIEQQGM